MGQILKTILSPDDVQAGERIEHAKATTEAQIRGEIERERALLTPDGSADVTDVQGQAGRRLSRAEVVRRLKRLNPNLWYEQSRNYPSQGGMYIAEPWTPFGKRMVCAFPHDAVNEFDVRLTTPKVIPDPTIALHWQTIQAVDGRVPGWRTALLRLILDGLITPSGAEKEFQITQGRSSQKWQEAIH